ncbi:MAG: hypothetical protein WHS43_07010 [Aquificaceae bacterium]|uniref:hypothetical protein n=1 Tax=Hydrogenobacter sp. Uz 6-8 TaxID=3384828 RepID=UPI0030A80233
MLKINVDAETKNIKPSGNSKLGEDGRRWDTVFCHHIDCNALSIMSTILPIPQATLGLENNRWEALYTKVVSAENVQADSLQSREVSTENISGQQIQTQTIICESMQTDTASIDNISSQTASIDNISSQNVSSSNITAQTLSVNNITAQTLSVNNLNASSSLSSSNINTTNINVSYEAHIYSCIVHYYFRSPHIVFPNGWSIAPSGNGLAFYDSSGYAVLIVRNDGIWFNGQKIK